MHGGLKRIYTQTDSICFCGVHISQSYCCMHIYYKMSLYHNNRCLISKLNLLHARNHSTTTDLPNIVRNHSQERASNIFRSVILKLFIFRNCLAKARSNGCWCKTKLLSFKKECAKPLRDGKIVNTKWYVSPSSINTMIHIDIWTKIIYTCQTPILTGSWKTFWNNFFSFAVYNI